MVFITIDTSTRDMRGFISTLMHRFGSDEEGLLFSVYVIQKSCEFIVLFHKLILDSSQYLIPVVLLKFYGYFP